MSQIKPLAFAIHLAVLGSTGLCLSTVAHATIEVKTYNVAAGTLSVVLSKFAQQSGASIIVDAAKIQGLKSNGLQGAYGVEQGFSEILKQTNLNVEKTAQGYVLVEKPVQTRQVNSPRDLGQLRIIDVNATATNADNNTVQLPVIVVTAENDNSYTVKNTSTATRMNLSIKDTPQSISVITRQHMDDQNLTNIPKVLEQTPGILLSRDAGERISVYSRGNEITKYQFDGITTHVESQTANITQQLADTSIYDKVEVVRGATGLMTGAGNPSGVLNMVRKNPTKEFQASVTGSIGRWDDYRGSVDVSGSLINNGKLRGRIVVTKQDNDTFTDYYSQNRDVLYGVAEADLTDSTTVRFGIDYQKYEIDGGTGVPLFYTDNEQTNLSRSTTVTSKLKNEKLETTNYFFNIDQALPNKWKLVIAGNYMNVDREISNMFIMRQIRSAAVNKETGEFPAGRTNKITNPLNQKSAAINLQGPFSLFGREHQAIAGYEFSRYKSDWKNYGYSTTTANLSNIHEIPPTPNNEAYGAQDFYITQRGYYGAMRLKPFDKFHIIVGARTSDYKYDTYYDVITAGWGYGSSYKKTGEVTPYAGLVYDLTPEQSMYISYTDIFNPNNVTDINGKVIEPQIGANYEIGWKGEFYNGRLNANAAIYQVKRDNVTELVGYNDSNVAYYRAVDGMETKGIDLEISGEVLSGWNVSGSYSHSKSEGADGSRGLNNMPKDIVILWNTYNFYKKLQGLTIGGGARWLSKTSYDYVTLPRKAVQDDYIVVDAMASYKFNHHLSGTLNISNLFDKKYMYLENVGYGFYGQPRNAVASLTYKF